MPYEFYTLKRLPFRIEDWRPGKPEKWEYFLRLDYWLAEPKEFTGRDWFREEHLNRFPDNKIIIHDDPFEQEYNAREPYYLPDNKLYPDEVMHPDPEVREGLYIQYEYLSDTERECQLVDKFRGNKPEGLPWKEYLIEYKEIYPGAWLCEADIWDWPNRGYIDNASFSIYGTIFVVKGTKFLPWEPVPEEPKVTELLEQVIPRFQEFLQEY